MRVQRRAARISAICARRSLCGLPVQNSEPVRPSHSLGDAAVVTPPPQIPSGDLALFFRRVPPASRAPSLCPATVSLMASANFNGICNRQ